MWRASSSKILSPVAYATLIQRLPRRCHCLVATVDEDVVGFVVAFLEDEVLHIVDMQLERSQPSERLYELLQAVLDRPELAGARMVEAEPTCSYEMRASIVGMAPTPIRAAMPAHA